jgi:hypothetical protein
MFEGTGAPSHRIFAFGVQQAGCADPRRLHTPRHSYTLCTKSRCLLQCLQRTQSGERRSVITPDEHIRSTRGSAIPIDAVACTVFAVVRHRGELNAVMADRPVPGPH